MAPQNVMLAQRLLSLANKVLAWDDFPTNKDFPNKEEWIKECQQLGPAVKLVPEGNKIECRLGNTVIGYWDGVHGMIDFKLWEKADDLARQGDSYMEDKGTSPKPEQFKLL